MIRPQRIASPAFFIYTGLFNAESAELRMSYAERISPVGLLINFNVRLLEDGVRRIVNNFPDPALTLPIPPRPLR